MQVFDDGMLNDSLGNTIDYKNTIIIMTSNIWSHQIMEKLSWSQEVLWDLYPIDILDQKKVEISKSQDIPNKRSRRSKKKILNVENLSTQDENIQREELEQELKPIMMEFFRPEFLNRVDNNIIFNPMFPTMFKAILEIKFKQQFDLIYSNSKITINLTNAAKNYIAKKWRDPANWARPIDRAIQNYLTNPLAKQIISWNFVQWDIVDITIENDKLIFQKNTK